jgi:hypothetical protein
VCWPLGPWRGAKPFRYLLHHDLSIQDTALLTATKIIAAEGITPLQRPFFPTAAHSIATVWVRLGTGARNKQAWSSVKKRTAVDSHSTAQYQIERHSGDKGLEDRLGHLELAPQKHSKRELLTRRTSAPPGSGRKPVRADPRGPGAGLAARLQAPPMAAAALIILDPLCWLRSCESRMVRAGASVSLDRVKISGC